MKGKKLVQKLLNAGHGKWNLLFAAIGMSIGVLLLLLSLQAYIDVNRLLYGKSADTGMADFLIINKQITARMMGGGEENTFSPEEIAELKKQPFIKATGTITSNRFKVSASAGSQLQFYTDLFFEAVPDSFLDNKPAGWDWKESDRVLPVMLSTDFLNLYNYGFALSQGLPQLSKASVKAVSFTITISNGEKSTNFQANIVGFSDRISSILVPQEFLDWANQSFSTGKDIPDQPSRLILKVTDPSNPTFVKYLADHHYETNQDKLKFSKIRLIVQTVISAIGIFGAVVVLLALIIFSIYLQLLVARAKEEIRLLITLGYSPASLGKLLVKQLMPLYLLILAAGVVFVEMLQWIVFHLLQQKNLAVSPVISLAVIALALTIFSLFYLITRRAIGRQMEGI